MTSFNIERLCVVTEFWLAQKETRQKPVDLPCVGGGWEWGNLVRRENSSPLGRRVQSKIMREFR